MSHTDHKLMCLCVRSQWGAIIYPINVQRKSDILSARGLTYIILTNFKHIPMHRKEWTYTAAEFYNHAVYVTLHYGVHKKHIIEYIFFLITELYQANGTKQWPHTWQIHLTLIITKYVKNILRKFIKLILFKTYIKIKFNPISICLIWHWFEL